MSLRYLVTDYETRSEADLKKVGAYEYANHPSTRVMCVSWRIGTLQELASQLETGVPAKVWSPARCFITDTPIYQEFFDALLDPSIIIVAHNAFFEKVITRFVVSKLKKDDRFSKILDSRWICTATLAAVLALPRKLEEVGAAIDLPIQKDKEGHRLMLKMSKPRRETKNNKSKWHSKISDLKRLMQYCATDVDAETLLLLKLPALTRPERALWLLNQKNNMRGFRVDRELVSKVLKMIPVEQARFENLTKKITNGEVASTAQNVKMISWLKRNGCYIPNLQKETVADAIKSGMASGAALSLLKVRQAASKSSTAKFQAFEMRSRTDGRVRDSVLYHAASTGRDGGAGVQPHNFPRPTIEETTFAAEFVKDPFTDLEMIRLTYGNPLDLFSNILRAVIMASELKTLFSGDFSQIEVRVLFWLAGHQAGLDAFINGEDLYIDQASEIYNRVLTKLDKLERQVGKKVILGAGFGLGWKKFLESCLKDGLENMTEELAQNSIKAYRRKHYPVVKLWNNLERAAIAAVKNPGRTFAINKTKWFMRGKFLMCQLPSGRCLAYYDPEIRYVDTPWGEKKPKLYHWDVHPKTKKWVLSGTYGGKLTENAVQAIARDIMMEATTRVDQAGYDMLFGVHDEAVAENGEGSESEFQELMETVPEWAAGIPIKVETWVGPRYKK